MHKQHHLTIGQETIAYSDQGHKQAQEVIIFLHGWKQSKEIWHQTIQAFTALGYRCVAIDLPGFGSSSLGSSYNLDQYAQIISQTLDKLAIKKCTLVGHSFGGKCAVAVTARNPKTIHKLILSSANIGYDIKPQIIHKILYFLLPYGQTKTLKTTFQRTHGNDLSTKLANIKCPSLLLYSQHDPIVTSKNTNLAQTYIKSSKTVIFGGFSHNIYARKPKQFIAEIKNFI